MILLSGFNKYLNIKTKDEFSVEIKEVTIDSKLKKGKKYIYYSIHCHSDIFEDRVTITFDYIKINNPQLYLIFGIFDHTVNFKSFDPVPIKTL